MKVTPLVTIVTPTYNHEMFIGECIDSVLAQSYENWELCIVDDGSTDKTVEIARRYSDPRIKIFTQTNKGMSKLSETYNSALAIGNGELVAILEGDDYWPTYKLLTQVEDFEDEDIVLSSGLFTIVDTDRSLLGVKPDPLPVVEALSNVPFGSAFFALLDVNHLTFTWPVSTVIRRSTLDRIGGFLQPDYLRIVDLPTFARLSMEGRFVYHENVSLGFWRRHDRSATKSALPKQLNGVHRLAFELLRDFGQLLSNNAQIDALDNQWASFQVHRLVLLARMLADKGRRSDAKFVFKHAMGFRGGTKRKIKVIAGQLTLALGLSPEPVYRLMRMSPWQRDAQLDGGDLLVDEGLFDELPQPIDLVQSAKTKSQQEWSKK